MNTNVKVKSYLRKGKVVKAYNYNKKVKNTTNTTVALASILGLSAGTFLAAKYKYLKNLDDIAKNLKPNNTGKLVPNKSINFSIGGYGYKTGKHITAVEQAEELTKLINKVNPDIHNVTINKGFTSSKPFKFQGRKVWSMFNGFFSNFLQGKSKISKDIAEEVYDYHLKNPGKPIYITGYSAGGTIAKDLGYIFKKKNIDLNLITLGEPDFRIVPNSQKSILSISSKKDSTHIFRPKNTIFVNSVNSHNYLDYTSNRKVEELISKFFKKTSEKNYSDKLYLSEFKKSDKNRNLKIAAGVVGTGAAIGGGLLLNKKLKRLYPGLNISKLDKLRFAVAKKIPLSSRNQYLVKEINNSIKKEPISTIGGFLRRVAVKPFTKKDGTVVRGYVRQVIAGKENVKILDNLDDFAKTANSSIKSFNTTFTVEKKGVKYIYKEAPKSPFGTQKSFGQIAAATEALASDIAESVGIKVQKTFIIPAGVRRPFGDASQPATLHEFVKGIPAIEAERKGLIRKAGIALKPYTDRRSLEPHNLVKKFMTTLNHPDTAKLTAFDIFIGNRDRHSNNYFYDVVTDSFTGIDHGGSGLYKPNFFEIKSSIAESFSSLDDTQKKNLSLFKETLNKLVKTNKPKDVLNRLDYYYDVAGAGKESIAAKAAKERNKDVLEYNYEKVKELIAWLEKAGI